MCCMCEKTFAIHSSPQLEDGGDADHFPADASSYSPVEREPPNNQQGSTGYDGAWSI